jgi:small-conductance mechanosensitive channel
MNLGIRKVLEFTVFKIKSYEISVFDLFVVILIFITSRFLVWAIQNFLKKRLFAGSRVDEGRQFAFQQLVKYFIYVVGLLLGFQAMGIRLSLLLAGSAALLVGVGLGLQQTFNDLVSGLILLFEGNVSVGDIIEINKLIGRVTAIGIRTSKVETRDAVIIIVPNSKFIVDNVINWSHNRALTRFSIPIHTSYNNDPELVKQALLECVKNNRDIVEKPAPFTRLQNFGENALEFELLFWTHNVWRIENLKSEIRYAIFKTFQEKGIQIPYPQREIYIRNTDFAIPPTDAWNDIPKE